MPSAVSSPSSSDRVGRWTDEEHELFLKGLAIYGRRWKKIAGFISTRNTVQVRSHAQKYEMKLAKAHDLTPGAAHKYCLASGTKGRSSGYPSSLSATRRHSAHPTSKAQVGKNDHVGAATSASVVASAASSSPTSKSVATVTDPSLAASSAKPRVGGRLKRRGPPAVVDYPPQPTKIPSSESLTGSSVDLACEVPPTIEPVPQLYPNLARGVDYTSWGIDGFDGGVGSGVLWLGDDHPGYGLPFEDVDGIAHTASMESLESATTSMDEDLVNDGGAPVDVDMDQPPNVEMSDPLPSDLRSSTGFAEDLMSFVEDLDTLPPDAMHSRPVRFDDTGSTVLHW